MSSLYLHIPFCKSVCAYCNFHFTTSLLRKDEMITQMQHEIILQNNFLNSKKLNSLYFGGGTPSLLDNKDIEKLFSTITKNFSFDENIEITLEANPDDVSQEKLKFWKNIGINRLSLGVQSFFDDDLIWLKRIHSAKQSLKAIEEAKKYFDNISVDLIFGFPSLTDEKWEKNLTTATALDILHLSCYSLTIEPKTFLYKQISKNILSKIQEPHQAKQFEMVMDYLGKNGYEHYEISNYAKQNFRSRHNAAYWDGEQYLAIGPGGHSFDGKIRQWNVSNNLHYINSLQQNTIPAEKEILTDKDIFNEFIFLSLRQSKGIDENKFVEKFGGQRWNKFLLQAEKYFKENILIYQHKKLFLSKKGILLADNIMSSLFE